MNILKTHSFGTLEYGEDDLIRFPEGIPGFENEKLFIAVERPREKPVIFLQSAVREELFFITLPIESIDDSYELQLSEEDETLLGGSDPGSEELMCLALVCFPDEGVPTANLLGPLVIHRDTQIGVQAIRNDARYSASHPLTEGVNERCS